MQLIILVATCFFWGDNDLHSANANLLAPGVDIYLVSDAPDVTVCHYTLVSKSSASTTAVSGSCVPNKAGKPQFCIQWSDQGPVSLASIVLELKDRRQLTVRVDQGVAIGKPLYIVVRRNRTVFVTDSLMQLNVGPEPASEK